MFGLPGVAGFCTGVLGCCPVWAFVRPGLLPSPIMQNKAGFVTLLEDFFKKMPRIFPGRGGGTYFVNAFLRRLKNVVLFVVVVIPMVLNAYSLHSAKSDDILQ